MARSVYLYIFWETDVSHMMHGASITINLF